MFYESFYYCVIICDIQNIILFGLSSCSVILYNNISIRYFCNRATGPRFVIKMQWLFSCFVRFCGFIDLLVFSVISDKPISTIVLINYVLLIFVTRILNIWNMVFVEQMVFTEKYRCTAVLQVYRKKWYTIHTENR